MKSSRDKRSLDSTANNEVTDKKVSLEYMRVLKGPKWLQKSAKVIYTDQIRPDR